MIDINMTDFIDKFDIKKATVGVVGHGYVGKAIEHFFKKSCNVIIHDKAKPELATLTEVLKNAEIIFIAVPTPMRSNGSCHTGIVESVISNIRDTAKEIERNLDSFVVIVKSTVYPGFTEEMQEKYFGMRILFSPEFLTEKNSIKDFENINRVLLGGDEDDARVVFKYFEGVIPEKIKNDRVLLLQCDPTVAEMTKLYTNGILATKILFSNEVYLVCQQLGINYEEVRVLSVLDPRIGSSHTSVPGHDGQLGFGGHCFPKDINNLKYVANEANVPERLFTTIIKRNEEIREKKDWLDMQGRAVINE